MLPRNKTRGNKHLSLWQHKCSVKKHAAKYSQHKYRKPVSRFSSVAVHWALRATVEKLISIKIEGEITALFENNCSLTRQWYKFIFFNMESVYKCLLFIGEQSCRPSSEFLLPALRSGELCWTHWGADSVQAVHSPHGTKLTRHTAGEQFLTIHTQI